jgi:hypothetical protein
MMHSPTAILPAWLIERVDAYWARWLGCSVADLYAPKPLVQFSSSSPGVVGVRRGDHWVLNAHPAHSAAQVETLLNQLNAQPTHDDIDGLLAQRRGIYAALGLADGALWGPTELFYTTRTLMKRAPNAPFPIRRLTEQDQDAFHAFRAEFGPLNYTLDDPQRFRLLLGCFDGERLVATGAVQVWDETLAETYADTLLQYRGYGLASALVTIETDWIVNETDYIAQCDGELISPPSIRIAHKLGYHPYGYLIMTNLDQSVS